MRISDWSSDVCSSDLSIITRFSLKVRRCVPNLRTHLDTSVPLSLSPPDVDQFASRPTGMPAKDQIFVFDSAFAARTHRALLLVAFSACCRIQGRCPFHLQHHPRHYRAFHSPPHPPLNR